MKKTLRMIAICMVLFVGGAFVLPVQMDTLDAHAAVKMKISKTRATIKKGKTIQLKIKNRKGKKVTWKSSNRKVATVKNGKVRAKKKGKAVITAKVGKKKFKCSVTVKNPTRSSRNDNSGNSGKKISNYVYISATGEKYHRSANCSNMKNPRKISLKDAKNRGYEPCKKCYK